MSTNVTESDTFPANVPTPVIGDKYTYPTTVTSALTSLASRARYHENTLQATAGGASEFVPESDLTSFNGTAYVQLPPGGRAEGIRSPLTILAGKIKWLRELHWSGGADPAGYYMSVPIVPNAEGDGTGKQVVGTYWAPVGTLDEISYFQQNITSPYRIYWPILGLPPKGRIVDIGCYLDAQGGHAALPGTMPKLRLVRQTENQAPSTTTIATATDTSANTTVYQSGHTVHMPSGMSEIITQPYPRYFFVLEGESGANALAGLKLIGSWILIDKGS